MAGRHEPDRIPRVSTYALPIAGLSLSVDFVNTVWVSGGRTIDALESGEGLQQWLDAVADRLAEAGCRRRLHASGPLRRVLLTDRREIRALFTAATTEDDLSAATRRHLNGLSRGAPIWLEIDAGNGKADRVSRRRNAASNADIRAAICDDALQMVATHGIHCCGGPGCIGFFVAAPRQQFCSPQCSTRARVLRHRRRESR